MSRPELFALEGPFRYYWKYFTPTVYDRLVGYYASDQVYAAVQNALAIVEAVPAVVAALPDIAALVAQKPTLDWYVDVSSWVSELVTRADTLTSTADQLVGVIVAGFFDKVADLVGGHVNLTWYAKPEVVAPAVNIFSRATDIVSLIDFLFPGSPQPTPFEMLKDYVSTDWYDAFKGLKGVDGDLLGGLKGIYDIRDKLTGLGDRYDPLKLFSDGLGAQASLEGIDLSTIMGRLRGYASKDWYNILGNVPKGYLPSLIKNALVEFEGRINLLEDVKKWIDANVNTVHFYMPAYNFWIGATHAHYDDQDFGYGMKGFRKWIAHMKWYIEETTRTAYPLAFLYGFGHHFAAGFAWMDKMADFMDKLMARWG